MDVLASSMARYVGAKRISSNLLIYNRNRYELGFYGRLASRQARQHANRLVCYDYDVTWCNLVSSLENCLILPLIPRISSWTIVYDTQYACQDRADDAKLGIKSTALLFGENVQPILIGFATVFVLSLVSAGILNGQTTIYYVVCCGGAAAHLTWQFATWDINDVEDCGRKFKVSGDNLTGEG